MEAGRPKFHRRLVVEIPGEADLYEKLKAFPWNATTEIDWSRPIQNYSEAAYQAARSQVSGDSPDPLMRDLITLVLRDESRQAGFGVIYLANRFRDVSRAERARIEQFVGDLWRLFHDATASPFGGVNEFLADTFVDIRHRLQRVGLELR
jgi:hypothetical protein